MTDRLKEAGIHRRIAETLHTLEALHRELAALLEKQPPLEAGVMLDVPYLSQWDAPDADDRPGDCGPACVAMLAHYLTDERPTVDDAATAAGQPRTAPGKWYTGHAQLRAAARAFGLNLLTRSPASGNPLALDLVEIELAAGRPVIALINYGTLADDVGGNQDSFRGGHWVLVIGYDADNFYIHDPDFWGTRRFEGAERRVSRQALGRAMATVSATAGNNYNWQGLTVKTSA
jgi:uncharacterized protein YvpB